MGASPSCWLLVFLSLAAVFGALVLYCGFGIGRFKLRSTQVLHLLSLAGQPSLFWSPPVRAEPHRWVFFPVFSFFFIMPRRFPRSVTINVKKLADLGKTRPEVVSAIIINLFHPIKPIVAIQLLGYDTKVTFESEAHKREVIDNEYVCTEGIDCSVWGGGGGVALGPRMSLFIISLIKSPMQLCGSL